MAIESNKDLIEKKTTTSYALTNKVNNDQKTPYAAPAKQKVQPEEVSNIAKKYAPNKDKPTTADGKEGKLDLPSLIAAVDPQGLSSIAPMMYSMLGQITAASKGGSESSRKRVVEDALSGALSILSNKYTFDYLTLVLNNALDNGDIQFIVPKYRDIVKNAIANLFENYITYGEGQIPVSSYQTVTTITQVPPSPVVSTVPDLYMQVYYTFDADPYPGYIEWVSQDGTTKVYTARKLGDLYYSTADEEVYSAAEQALAAALDPLIATNTLTAQFLNDSIAEQDASVEENTSEKTGGKNAGKNVTEVLAKLAGYAGQISNLQQSIQLPMSVLNQGKIKKSLDGFMKNIGQLKQEKDKARQAAMPINPINALTSNLGKVQQIANMAQQAKSLYDKVTKS